MRTPRLVCRLSLLALLAGCTTDEPPLTDADMIGTWHCGPTTMRGPGFELVVTSRVTHGADHTSSSVTTSVISRPDMPDVTNEDAAWGRWDVEGREFVGTVERVEFLSSTDPETTKERGQKMLDDILRLKTEYRSRVLEHDGTHTRSVPIDAMFEEAEVETRCTRASG